MTNYATPADALTAYTTWLDRQPLAANTKRAYHVQVRQYCDYLTTHPPAYDDPLTNDHARDYAVRDYKTYLKVQKKRKPTTVNLALAAIDHFYNFLGLGEATVQREGLPQQAPQALNIDEQKTFLRAVERSSSVRDQAVALLLLHTGMRIGECAHLRLDDVLLSARKGTVIVRSGKGDSYREIPLNKEARKAQHRWLSERARQVEAKGLQTDAYFLNRYGNRLSSRSIDLLLRKIGADAGLDLSAHILRHTCLTNLVRAGHDLVLVAEIAGHRRLETTRRYSLPSAQDRAAAMESIQIDY